MGAPKRALFILEKPWWAVHENPQEASVLPFFQGLERLDDYFRVYHSTFFDASSFRAALKRMSESKVERAWLYVAAHGDEHRVGDIPFGKILQMIHEEASGPLEGFIIGSCFVGKNGAKIVEQLKGTSLRWAVAYTCAANWLTSTLIDLMIFKELIHATKPERSKAERLTDAFRRALAPFSPNYLLDDGLGEDDPVTVKLRDGLCIYVRPAGPGNLPTEVSAEVWSAAEGDEE